MNKPNKTAPAPIVRKRVAPKTKTTSGDCIIQIGVDREGKAIYGMNIPDYGRGTPVSVGFLNRARPDGLEYVKAWILEKCASQTNQVDCYQVSFGRNAQRRRAVIPMTNIHAACLATT